MKIQAEAIAHSKNEFGDELITYVATFPRYILAELNTHRMFSRNSASSRAIPTNKMIQSLEENPFIPIAWQKEHKGMQGTQYITDPEEIAIEINQWLSDLNYNIQAAKARLSRGVTKQLANRPLETYMWHTAIITTGKEGLENFFDLRCPVYLLEHVGGQSIYKSRKEFLEAANKEHGCAAGYQWQKDIHLEDDLRWLKLNLGQADIHMMALAECMYDAYRESKVELLAPGAWHIPYKDNIEDLYDKANLWCYDSEDSTPNIAYISSVMCARVSYTVPGHDLTEWTLDKYLNKAHELAKAKPLHASPFEHAAYAPPEGEYFEYSKTYPGIDKDGDVCGGDIEYGWCRNFKGFVQLRHVIETKR